MKRTAMSYLPRNMRKPYAIVLARKGLALFAVATLAACRPKPVTPPAPVVPQPIAAPPANALPPIPLVQGPLVAKVVYPQAGQFIQSRDSTFVLGSVGNGKATLTINGLPVKVEPNG